MIDISEEYEVSSAEYPAVSQYKYKSPIGYYAIIDQISFSFNSAFLSTGKLRITFANQIITSSGENSSEISISNNFTVPFKNPHVIALLEPNSEITASFRTTGDPGVVQVQVSGHLVSKEELDQIKRNGGAI